MGIESIHKTAGSQTQDTRQAAVQGSNASQSIGQGAATTASDNTVKTTNLSDSQADSVSMKDAKAIAKYLNKNTVAEFGYNEPTHRFTITIKERDSGKVLKEIPSEESLEMFAKALEVAGITVDEKR